MLEFILGFILGSGVSILCYSLILASKFNEKELK